MTEPVSPAPSNRRSRSARAALARRRLRVVLIQIRGMPEAKHHEQRCILECTGLAQEQLEPWSVLDQPEIRWHDLSQADAIIIGGSGDHSVTRDYPFTPWLEEVVQSAVAHRKPLFGICWGHHMLARALGGRVVTDPEREEVGTYEVELTSEGRDDALFSGFASRFDANLVHHDSIAELPAGFRELAATQGCPLQTIKLDDAPVYGTQFHGEMTPEQLRRRLLMYRGYYLESDEQTAEVADQLRPTDEANGLLRRFLELYT
ncbi:MAG: type 1 glutamine amidotransferase [Acidobacteriota bacterium]